MARPLLSRATFGAGCFWGMESIFGRHTGVIKTASVYVGGTTPHPSYEQVCSANRTRHAEAVTMLFDPSVTSFDKLLATFWRSHDPASTAWLKSDGTSVPRPEGTNACGSVWQYRSEVFAHSAEQAEEAQAQLQRLQYAQREVGGGVALTAVSQVASEEDLYFAEAYHQKYVLQQHPTLWPASGLAQDTEVLFASTLAAKLCGLAGASTTAAEAEALVAEVRELGASQELMREAEAVAAEKEAAT